jgi:hypothetical protein
MSMLTARTTEPSRKPWLWYSTSLTLLGYALIGGTVYANAHTLFDYNGQPSPGETEVLSGMEALVVVECLVLAAVVGALLRGAWRADRRQVFISWRLPLVLLSGTTVALALCALAYAASEIIH